MRMATGFKTAFLALSMGLVLATSIVLPQASAKLINAEQNLHEFKLPNGQLLYVRNMPGHRIVTIDTWVNVGSEQETPENNGLSHFLEHLLFKGTPTYTNHAIDEKLGELGASFNAATSKDYTHFYISAAAPYFKKILPIHADMMLNADIPTVELDSERLVVQEEINRALDNPQRKVFSALTSALFKNHPYAQETLGPKKNIASIPREAILEYYHRWYAPQNFVTVVVGDIDPNEAKKLVTAEFSKSYQQQKKRIAPSNARRMPLAQNLASKPQVNVIADPNISQPTIIMAFLAPPMADQTGNLALDVAAHVLGDGETSRLGARLKGSDKIARNVSSGNMTLFDAGVFYMDAETTLQDLPKARAAMLEELLKLKRDGVSCKEFSKIKKQVQKSFANITESTEDYANSVGSYALNNRLNDFTQYNHALAQLSCNTVNTELNKNTDLNQLVIVELLPGQLDTNALNAESTALQQLVNKAQKVDAISQAPAEVSLPNPAPNLTPISADGTQSVWKAGENTTVLLKHQPNVETIAMHLLFKGGGLTETKVGQSSLAAQVILKGTTTKTANQLAEIAENNALSASSSSNNDYFSITVESLKDDFPLLVELLADMLANNQIDDTVFNTYKNYFLQNLSTTKDTPQSVLSEGMEKALFPNHPYGKTSDDMLASVPNLTQADLKAFIKQLQSQPVVISIAGDLNNDQAREKLKPLLSALNTTRITPELPQIPEQLPVASTTVIKRPSLAASWIAMGWHGPSIQNKKDYVAMKVVNMVLGGDFTARMFKAFRLEEGLAYEAGSGFSAGLLESPLIVYVGTDAKNEAYVTQKLANVMKTMIDKGISNDELTHAKQKIVGQFLLGHEDNNSQAYYPALYELLGVGYQFDTEYPKLIEAVTQDDVKRVIKTYLTTPGKTVIVSPETLRKENDSNNEQ